jgi:adenylate cyclase
MRGDGAFCLFDSSTEAVRCAIRIQQAIRAEVPLRIGLHLGDITERDGNHIFGDAVNVASRIESMGAAGAVLLVG